MKSMVDLQRVLLVLYGILILATKATSQPKLSACLDRCGSVSIPYPFGTTDGCYLEQSFQVICNRSHNPPRLTFPNSSVAIINISLDGVLRIGGSISRGCYNDTGNLTNNRNEIVSKTYTFSRFPISSTMNKFTAVGCRIFGTVQGSKLGRDYLTGCASVCNQIEHVRNGSCSGVGCCQMSMPEGVRDYATTTSWVKLLNNTTVHNINPCGYAFVADQTYDFSSMDARFQNRETTVPVLLDWSVSNQTCEKAKQNASTYACKAEHSKCVDLITNGPGYRCKCSSGFEGNPYLLHHGCQDIDECESSTSNPCIYSDTCENLSGSFKCHCPKGYEGDGLKTNGIGCNIKDDQRNQTAQKLGIALGTCLGLLILLFGGSWIYWGLQKRKLIKLKEKFFKQNGGLLLKQQLSQYRGSVETAKAFTADELNKATNNYDQSRVLGKGGYGTVYKGVLTGNKVVAIKKSKIGDQSQIEQFVNEVIVLSQINHRNVVKLIGCCLETEVPLLVYEFITNGTLSDHIHNKGKYSSLSWKMRLKIAKETASALAYLHSSTSMPIIHRDVKTANILLDDNYTAKVADFGASRLVPLDQTQLTTLVQGTLGYLDPEYFHTSQLTEKTDVYSFGVVLAELLTGQKALSFNRLECDRNLAMYFVSSMNENRLRQILDSHLVVDEETIQKMKVVANVAKECLQVKGEERPTMKEVATGLEVLNNKAKQPWEADVKLGLEENEFLLKPSDPNLGGDRHGASSSGSNITAGVRQHEKSYNNGR